MSTKTTSAPVGASRRTVLAAGAAAAAAIAMPAVVSAQSRLRLTIVTGGTGGVFYPYGGGLAKVLSEKVPNVQATAQVTGGSVDNVKLLHTGDADIGFATLDSAYDGFTGTAAYQSEGKQDVRVLAVLYDSFLHLVASGGAGVAGIPDLRGKRVSVGSVGSSTESIADRLLAAGGLDPMKDVGRDNLGVAESVGALKDGKVAAFFWIGGIPTAAVRDLATSGQPPIRFIPTDKELTKLEAQFPGLYRPFNLPKTAYAGMSEDVPGLGVPNVLLVSAKARDEMVTTVLNGIFGNLEEVHKIHPEARKLTLQAAAGKTAVPFHPAAEAFYKSKGAM
ncbi:MAG TPA: TAXI family TRAP transporter solute-binding subunit [Azospirillaceae bacterium]|nr:TAXI family TRAP transporter solute-binding subunit [Azospirillaceae bacterium]